MNNAILKIVLCLLLIVLSVYFFVNGNMAHAIYFLVAPISLSTIL